MLAALVEEGGVEALRANIAQQAIVIAQKDAVVAQQAAALVQKDAIIAQQAAVIDELRTSPLACGQTATLRSA